MASTNDITYCTDRDLQDVYPHIIGQGQTHILLTIQG